MKLKTENLIFEIEEQKESLIKAGYKMLKSMILNIFGAATGSKVNFSVSIINYVGDIDQFDLDTVNQINIEKKRYSVSSIDTNRDERSELKDIIEKKRLSTYLQPVVDLSSLNYMGYEVLTRGPENSRYFQPAVLFGKADKYNLKEKLELACVANGLEWIKELPPQNLLFINTSPDVLVSKELSDLLIQDKYSDYFSNILFEITEHMPLKKVNIIKERVEELKKLGVKIALDDIGCGFFDLDSIKQLKPEIVKLCITVTNRLQDGKNVQNEIQNAVNEIKEIDSSIKILTEGVENEEQMKILESMNNIDLAQGYYFKRPEPAAIQLSNFEKSI
ncbi:MAG: EAL domain-containing protein [Halanaerobiales bacterium]